MNDKRKIVIGLDPERESNDALALGALLARILPAQPIVISALPWPSYLALAEYVREEVEVRLRERFRQIEQEMHGLDVQTRWAAGRSPAETLGEQALEEGADLIVVGSCHRGSVGRTLAGSVGESLLHGAQQAVAVAPRGFAHSAGPIRRIAVAFDGSRESWGAVDTGCRVAAATRSEVTIVAVAGFEHYGYAAAWSVLMDGEIRNAEHREKSRLLELAARRAPYGVAVDTRLETGDAGSVLSDISPNYDLMLTGSRAYGPMHRTLLGSTTRKLIRSASCPVVVLPRGAGDDPLRLGADRDATKAPAVASA